MPANANLIVLAPVAATLCVLTALRLARRVRRAGAGTPEMQAIARAIERGASVFLRQEFRAVARFVAVVALAMVAASAWGVAGMRPATAFTFVLGASASLLAGYIGMRIAVQANVRTADAAASGVAPALRLAHSGGSVTGLMVVGLGLWGLLLALGVVDLRDAASFAAFNGFAFGASSIALFARVGGGIFTKAADVGADIVGKLETGLAEDDPRNPAVIADNVGDNVGDVAGMSADLFESYVGSIVAAVGLAVNQRLGDHAVALPFVLAAVGALASIAAIWAANIGRPQDGAEAAAALRRGVVLAGGLFAAGAAALGALGAAAWTHVATAILGLAGGVVLGALSEYYTAPGRGPVREVAAAARTGPATVVLSGFAWGMLSAALPVLAVSGIALAAYMLDGLYGIAVASVGMLAITGSIMAVDAYGPIADNAGGIAEMARLPKGVREVTDQLDALGNSTAAVGKGLAIGSAALTALALFSAFTEAARLPSLSLLDAPTLVGLLLGAVTPYVFAAWAIRAVERAAGEMVEEVRRQFREVRGLLQGEADPDPERCVAISSRAALKEMVLPGVAAVAIPIAVGVILGRSALGGLLAGAAASGVVLAVTMANAGAAWDNAKKEIEAGLHGGKGSPAHAAAVVGDTVGDPFKDTAGPSLNILIKVMCVVALLAAPLLR
ncbi:MAG: sodium-translocating pyrophosphatase [Clostridia bacterium]|nr:sodium-translocating pyrophosphatase [Clostridia bacterium]